MGNVDPSGLARRRVVAAAVLVAGLLIAVFGRLVAGGGARASGEDVAPIPRNEGTVVERQLAPGASRADARRDAPRVDAERDLALASAGDEPAAIRGRVRHVYGDPLGPGARVLVYEPLAPPDARAVWEAVAGGPGDVLGDVPGARIVETDAAGRFVVEGLRAGASYGVCAGSKGYLSMPKGNVRPGPDELELRVRGLYGARLRLFDAEGGAARVSAALDVVPVRWKSAARGALSLGPSGFRPVAVGEAALAGVEPVPDGDRGVLNLLFAWDGDEDRMGPCFASVELPGYEPEQIEFEATFVGYGLVEIPWTLRRACEGFGTLRVRFVGYAGEVLRCLDRFEGRGLVVLGSESGRQDAFAVRSVVETLELPDVPFGTYTAAFHARNGMYVSPAPDEPPRGVVVGAEPAVLELDLSSAGAVELSVADALGEPYRGPLAGVIGAGSASNLWSGRNVAEMEAPYRFGPLQAGGWSILFAKPMLVPEQLTDDGVIAVDVIEGRVARVAVTRAD